MLLNWQAAGTKLFKDCLVAFEHESFATVKSHHWTLFGSSSAHDAV
jgi:hypothetical protein